MFYIKFATIKDMMNIILFLLMLLISVFALWKNKSAYCLNNEKDAVRGKGHFLLKLEPCFVIFLFIIGVLVRCLWFWRFPAGFNQDEASIGYDAFADIAFGMDRNGYHHPVYSVAWGSGHSGLYIALLHITVRLFGLSVFSVRVVNVFFGCAALFAFYGILRRLRGKTAALIGLFFMVVNPWHIMMCRWGLECNLFPNVFLIGLYCLVRGRERAAWYYAALFIFGLSLYAYGTSYIFLPVFLLISAFMLLKNKEIKVKEACAAAVVFLVTAVPIGIFMLVNVFGVKAPEWGFLSFPKLIEGRYYTTVTVLKGSFFKNCLLNLCTFLKILFLQSDGLIFNSIPGFGILYMFSLPLILPGIIAVLKNRENKGRLILFSMAPASLVLVMLTQVNINRANIVFILMIYLMTEGLYAVSQATAKLFLPVLSVYCLSFFLFIGVYFTAYQPWVGASFFEGFGEAVMLAAEETEKTVYLSETVNQPYIYALFYEKTDPQIFMDTVVYKNPGSSVRQVISFDRFVTGLPESVRTDEDAAYVASLQEAEAFSDSEFKKKRVGNYVVISPGK